MQIVHRLLNYAIVILLAYGDNMVKRSARNPHRKIGLKPRSRLIEMVEDIEDKGYKVFPSTERLVRNYTRKASEYGLITSQQELSFCAATLLSAGVQNAERTRKKTVSPTDIKFAWQRLSALGGNCPPHQCIRRSIINQKEKLITLLPILKDLIEER